MGSAGEGFLALSTPILGGGKITPWPVASPRSVLCALSASGGPRMWRDHVRRAQKALGQTTM